VDARDRPLDGEASHETSTEATHRGTVSAAHKSDRRDAGRIKAGGHIYRHGTNVALSRQRFEQIGGNLSGAIHRSAKSRLPSH